MQLKVDRETCIGCGSCVDLCPDVFEMDDEDKAIVKDDANYDDCDPDEAVDVCPVDAISKA
jgi:ferredoxin